MTALSIYARELRWNKLSSMYPQYINSQKVSYVRLKICDKLISFASFAFGLR